MMTKQSPDQTRKKDGASQRLIENDLAPARAFSGGYGLWSVMRLLDQGFKMRVPRWCSSKVAGFPALVIDLLL
ncbi:hypothetical protein [Bradyrhizobium sp.]|uniref:hypothetical protein n=1 Tax=Bradyrhizobium sp. TaxID=376 RepID=UPI003C51D658